MHVSLTVHHTFEEDIDFYSRPTYILNNPKHGCAPSLHAYKNTTLFFKLYFFFYCTALIFIVLALFV